MVRKSEVSQLEEVSVVDGDIKDVIRLEVPVDEVLARQVVEALSIWRTTLSQRPMYLASRGSGEKSDFRDPARRGMRISGELERKSWWPRYSTMCFWGTSQLQPISDVSRSIAVWTCMWV